MNKRQSATPRLRNPRELDFEFRSIELPSVVLVIEFRADVPEQRSPAKNDDLRAHMM